MVSTRKLSAFFVTSMMVFALALTGCASKKKAGAGEGQDGANSASGEGLTLELNGDSDSNKAGALRTVYFEYDSSEITEEGKTSLSQNAEFLKTNAAVKVQIEGHCDERGGVQYNMALGERRAKSVRDFMASLGVENSRLSVISYGKERPLELGHDDSAWSKNRRGNFVVTEK
jgi:peptidoglycan-associated lipoprotein